MRKIKALLVTTAHRGVFFGYGKPTRDTIITLERARMCIYWSADVKGVLGLAVKGPTEGCRIGPTVGKITLQDVTSITEVSSEATAAWEKETWS
jgi:hypothetical protein